MKAACRFSNKKALRPPYGTKGHCFRGTTQIRALGRALAAPVTEGLRSCLHDGSRANQTAPPQSGLQPVTGPLLAALTVIFPFIADFKYILYHKEGEKAREKCHFAALRKKSGEKGEGKWKMTGTRSVNKDRSIGVLTKKYAEKM